jgi:hypothetical protein
MAIPGKHKTAQEGVVGLGSGVESDFLKNYYE